MKNTITIEKFIFNRIKNIPDNLLENPGKDIKNNYKLVLETINLVLSHLKVKNDLGGSLFMREIAMVESKMGTDKNTVRNDNYGKGIFQIDKIGFDETKNIKSHPNLKPHLDALKKNTNIDWIDDVDYDDCNKFYYGAIACRLLMIVKPDAIPETICDRAKYWKKHYNTDSGKGTAKHYIERVNSCYKTINGKTPYVNVNCGF